MTSSLHSETGLYMANERNPIISLNCELCSRNGGYATSPLVGRFCGSEIPPIIPSFSNTLYLKFKSDSSHYGGGFNILWDGTATGDDDSAICTLT